MALLEVSGVTVRFGGNVALDNVEIAAEPGIDLASACAPWPPGSIHIP